MGIPIPMHTSAMILLPACDIIDLNARSGQDEATPLHLACRYNSGSATQFVLGKLLAINAKDAINFKDAKGRTPLHYATRRGHDLVIKVSI